MTVIAWDGTTLAADKMMGFGTSQCMVTKISRIGDSLAGYAGLAATGRALFDWLEKGRKPEDFPSAQRQGDDKSGSLLVIERDGTVLHYSTEPYPMKVEDKFYTIGSGGEFALAAMFLGHTAREAVNVAIALSPTCGLGIDTLELRLYEDEPLRPGTLGYIKNWLGPFQD